MADKIKSPYSGNAQIERVKSLVEFFNNKNKDVKDFHEITELDAFKHLMESKPRLISPSVFNKVNGKGPEAVHHTKQCIAMLKNKETKRCSNFEKNCGDGMCSFHLKTKNHPRYIWNEKKGKGILQVKIPKIIKKIQEKVSDPDPVAEKS